MSTSIARRLPLVRIGAALVMAVPLLAAGQTKPPATTTPQKPPVAPAKPAPDAQTSTALDRGVPFQVGEALTYNISWTTYATLGSATFTVKSRRAVDGGRAAYFIVADAQPRALLQKTYPLLYRADTLLDTAKLLPIQGSIFSEENGHARVKTTRFPTSGNLLDYEVKTSTLVRTKLQVPVNTQDPLSFLYVLRALPLGQDTAITIPVFDGGLLYRVRVVNTGPQQLKTPAGTFTAWQINMTVVDSNGQPPASGRRLTLWLSSDARMLPVKFDATLSVGSVVLTLARIGTVPAGR